ncbi:peptidase S41 [Myroides marinus]|uniref:S41 family peptidase n=1 Tax=Myroides marinus TaxID=703342 RepID=UPI000742447D|nr:S41 family peptidase [Myroides marinus]KUF38211.1 peptidase S41 [Myroides marinus]MDM1347736.1 peptidase S41 [Myroides marinus]MDM1351454.1 peptidase S41 [Myroides marinus]MDM1355094.1 peptidase S41 [Myroides marinus]MDM1358661.1 peptidase S41 [Myroides marinus]
MKRIKHNITILSLSILSLSSATVFTSCSTDDVTVTDPRRFTANDVQSYADLFEVFWKTMDQQYNYFAEQRQQGGLDWDEVYKTYHPKFAALKTYGRPGEDDGQINADFLAASGYFKEIINPIIDRHFNVKIQFPATNKNIIRTLTFFGGMLNEDNPNTYPFEDKFGYMQQRVDKNAFKSKTASLGIIAGNLTSNPDIYYLTFSQFAVTNSFKITLANQYLNPSKGNALLLTKEILSESEELNAIKDVNMRNAIKDVTFNILDTYNSYSESEVFKTFMQEVAKFNQTEIVTKELTTAAQKALIAYNALPKYNTIAPYGPLYNAATADYVGSFIGLMGNHINFGYNFPELTGAITQIIARAPFYEKFLNPLHNGDIKKIIIDLRSNGGGAVVDARFISDRFITKNTVFAYQRTREGNGRFNYTPWVEAKTKPHNFGIPANIPIAILTDKGSASMSEITTLMLKSQGNQVVSIGDYSAGATAGLGTVDDFNGGTRDAIAGGKLTFYMPLLAMKDANGVVVEGVGIKPNIYVTPPTDEELYQMASPNFVDRVLNEAINYLSSK